MAAFLTPDAGTPPSSTRLTSGALTWTTSSYGPTSPLPTSTRVEVLLHVLGMPCRAHRGTIEGAQPCPAPAEEGAPMPDVPSGGLRPARRARPAWIEPPSTCRPATTSPACWLAYAKPWRGPRGAAGYGADDRRSASPSSRTARATASASTSDPPGCSRRDRFTNERRDMRKPYMVLLLASLLIAAPDHCRMQRFR